MLDDALLKQLRLAVFRFIGATPEVDTISALVGLSIHSFFDGISIASGFVISSSLGLLLFVAIVLHKAPEGFTIASIMLAAGHGRRAAQLSAVAVGAASVLGALSVYPLQRMVGEGLAFSAGVTLYVAASDLIPEVNRSNAKAIAVVPPGAHTGTTVPGGGAGTVDCSTATPATAAAVHSVTASAPHFVLPCQKSAATSSGDRAA